MVKHHHVRLGFAVKQTDPAGGNRAVLDLPSFTPADTFIDVEKG